MDILCILKVLSNSTRLQILEWLKNPEEHFPSQVHMPKEYGFEGGVCVGAICAKAGLAQSVISGYLVKMQEAGLLESKRIGQHTCYRRNEKNIEAFKHLIQSEL